MSETAAKKANAQRVQKHRVNLRAAGLRPLQIWIPDTRTPHFLSEVRRQSELVAKSDGNDDGLFELLDDALEDLIRNSK